MARLTNEQLKHLMEKENVDRIWSWSRFNCFQNSPFEYYLKYIRHEKEDRADAIYTTTGGLAHDILERFYTGKLPYEEMANEFEDAWLTAFVIADLKFDRNDEEHNKQIADKYHDNLLHFFKTHTKIEYDVAIEQFAKAKIDDNLFHGYIDMCYKNDEGDIIVEDFKTSSIYKGKKAENEAGQLILYAISLHQQGIPLNKIKCCWNFLKYVTVQYEQANGTIKNRDIERVKIGESLQSNVKVWLKKLGYADHIDEYLKLLVDTNDIRCLPDDVQEKYSIHDCHVYIDLSEDVVNKWTLAISLQIRDIMLREEDYFEMKQEGLSEEQCCKTFWESEEEVKANSFYYSTLCDYSPSLHLPYKAYLDKLESQQNGNSLFNGVGSQSENVIESVGVSGKNNIDDLSWLNEI